MKIIMICIVVTEPFVMVTALWFGRSRYSLRNRLIAASALGSSSSLTVVANVYLHYWLNAALYTGLFLTGIWLYRMIDRQVALQTLHEQYVRNINEHDAIRYVQRKMDDE